MRKEKRMKKKKKYLNHETEGENENVDVETMSTLNMDDLCRVLIEMGDFAEGKLNLPHSAKLGPAYIKEWKIRRKMEVSDPGIDLATHDFEKDGPITFPDWREVSDSQIGHPPFAPQSLDDIFVHRPRLIVYNKSGWNDDIRSRASEYANLFGLGEEDVCAEGDFEQPSWYTDWNDTAKIINKGGITYRDLAHALSTVKSGKQDFNYELFTSATVSFPDKNTVYIIVSFDHGS